MTSSIFQTLASAALLSLVAITACADSTTGDSEPQASQDDRGPIAKADGAAGSCEDRCDSGYDETQSCQCDASCLEFEDCCADIVSLCEPECDDGDIVPSDDACNTCACDAEGSWSCTELACENECSPGDEQLADDGCNACSCQDDGTWSCTELDCEADCDPGDQAPAGDGCNSCICEADGQWSCTELDCGSECDPTLICGEAATCVGGELYPTICGPENCDEPIGAC